MPSATVPDFVPSRNGFAFPNWFPPGTPVLEVPTPFGRIPIGDANGGVCGGMVFAAMDLHRFRIAPPPEATPPVFRYLCHRLIDNMMIVTINRHLTFLKLFFLCTKLQNIITKE